MVLVTGGTGFVGRHVIEHMRRNDMQVRALVRDPRRSAFLEKQGVELVIGDISNPVSLRRALAKVERVVHLVGIIQEMPDASFQGIHVDGTQNMLNASKMAGVRHFFHMSALGTRPNAKSAYHRTKWEAEVLVRASSIPFTILRPSLIFGKGDGFTTRLIETISIAPFLPVIGSGKSKAQPIFVHDVASCIVKAVTSLPVLNETYEIGGPQQLSYEEMTTTLAATMGVRKPVFHVPVFLAKAAAETLGAVMTAPPLTADQITMLEEDNTCSMRDIRNVFGIDPIPFREGLAHV